MNLMFIAKYKNGGKLCSHNWFFNGVCKEIKPIFIVQLDVGVVPEKEGIFKMVAKMENNEKVGAVCGRIALRTCQVERKD